MRFAGANPCRGSLLLSAVAALLGCSNITETGTLPAEAYAVENLNGQLAPVGTTLLDSIGVKVIDAFGKPLAGIPVSWARIPGSGRVDPEATLTDAAGIARGSWKLDTVAGLMQAQAIVQGLSTPVRIDARALPGSVVRLTIGNTTTTEIAVGRTLALSTERSDGYSNVVIDGIPNWSTLDPSIASVSSGGVVTGVGPGTARIRAAQDAGVDTLILRVVTSAGSGWTALDVGGGGVGGHACALTAAGNAYCWGYNDGGQLGTGNIVPRNAPTPVIQPPSVRFTKIRSGIGTSKLTCALADNGEVYCWGETAVGSGQPFSRVPVRANIPGIAFRDLDVGRDHVCAVSTGNELYCWGNNTFGQLGLGTNVNSALPTRISALPAVEAVSLGAESSCAVSVTRAVFCWGRNSFGELAKGDTVRSSVPVAVSALQDVTTLFSGAEHRCAISTSGELRCWGRNDFGQSRATTVSIGTHVLEPVLVTSPGAQKFMIGSAGQSHTCAAVISQTLYCWGANESGQLGAGDTRDSPTARAVLLPTNINIAALSLSASFGCSLTSANEAYCWGSDSQGQLGNGAAPGSALPVRVDPP